jgi:predicted PurR-regulated permease PerM
MRAERSRFTATGSATGPLQEMMGTARKTLVVTAVVVSVLAATLALWQIRVVVALLFVALTIAAAIRPGVEGLHARRIPRAVGVLLHYVALLGVIALLLWLIVPQAIHQVEQALGGTTAHRELRDAAGQTNGVKHEFLIGLDRQLRHLPSAEALFHPAISVTKTAFEILTGILFTFAVAAYWTLERRRVEEILLSRVPGQKRKVIRDTWQLMDQKLGAFVRGQLVMIGFVSTVLSVSFWALGLPYWLLLGVFAGVVEMIPVVGPLAAGVLAVGVALTQSWQTALLTAVVVYGLRLLQDYVINPRVLGRVVGLSPLIVLVTASAVALLFGPFYVPLSVPLAAVVSTLVDVVVFSRDPADEPVPTVIFPARDGEVS